MNGKNANKKLLRVFTTFSGYDSQCLALEYAGIPFDLVGWSEIDKFAIKAHNALFPQYAERNYGDITAIDWQSVPDFDFLTYSSPCQDISQAGQQRGLKEGTRSSLLWQVEKCIKARRPKYMMMENVAALVSKKFIGDFQKWLDILEGYGYKNYWAKLNAKDYGVPQSRKRVICVSILDGEPFYYPNPVPMKKQLKDVLENDVEEKYFLSDRMVNCMINHSQKKTNERLWV